MEEKKYCKFCGEPMDINGAVCPKCGQQQEVVEPVAIQPTPSVEMNATPPQPEPVAQEMSAQVAANQETSVNVVTQTMTQPQETKYCKFCGGLIDKNSIVCPKCGRQLEKVKEEPTPVSYNQAPSQPVTNQKSKKGKVVKIIITIVVCLVVLGIIFGGGDDSKEAETNNETNNNNNNIIQENKKTSYTFNETFEFDDLEITIGENYTFTKVTNQYSDYYQKEAIKLPITIKNIKDQTHSLNMFYYSIFGSSGVEVYDLGFYFDDSIEYAGELRSGASYTTYLYFIYDGDGTYAIEFDDFWNKQTVEIEIKK